MGSTAFAPAPAPTDDAPLVLVIDDDPDARTICERALRASGYRTATAASGEAGLALLGELAPALVVLDLAMPGTDGFTVAETIRRDARCDAMPILIFTGLPREAAVRATGGSAFCTKPIEPQHFVAAVRRLCPLAKEGTTR
jgi:CheY-like chemotaxis protein